MFLVMIMFRTPNHQAIDLINLTADCMLILTIGVAFGYFVNLLTVMYRYRNPLTALGNDPRMSRHHTANGYEGRIIYSVYAGVWICLA
jgi:hypothetical protein